MRVDAGCNCRIGWRTTNSCVLWCRLLHYFLVCFWIKICPSTTLVVAEALSLVQHCDLCEIVLVLIVTVTHPEIVGGNRRWCGGCSGWWCAEHIGKWIAQLQEIIGRLGWCGGRHTAEHVDNIGAGAGRRRQKWIIDCWRCWRCHFCLSEWNTIGLEIRIYIFGPKTWANFTYFVLIHGGFLFGQCLSFDTLVDAVRMGIETCGRGGCAKRCASRR